jgi:hypothetical protein
MSDEWDEGEPFYDDGDDDAAVYSPRYGSQEGDDQGEYSDTEDVSDRDSDTESVGEQELEEEKHEEVEALKSWAVLPQLNPLEAFDSTFVEDIKNPNCYVLSIQPKEIPFTLKSLMGERFLTFRYKPDSVILDTLFKNVELELKKVPFPQDAFVIILYHVNEKIEMENVEASFGEQKRDVPAFTKDFIRVRDLNKAIDQVLSFKKLLQSIYVVQLYPSSSYISEDGLRPTELFYVAQAFPSYHLSRVNGIQYDADLRVPTIPLAYQFFTNKLKSDNRKAMPVRHQHLYIVDPISSELADTLLWKQKNGETGLDSIIKNIQFGRDEKTKDSWNRRLQDFKTKELETFRIDPSNIYYVISKNYKNMDSYLESLRKNIFYYEEIIKFLVLENGNFVRLNGASVSSLKILADRIKTSATTYFTNALLTSEHASLLDRLKQLQEENMNSTFYFPNLYEYEYIFQEFMVEERYHLSHIVNTEFYQNHYLIHSLGTALSDAVKSIIGIKTKRFILNEVILAKMKEVSPKLLLFLKEMPNPTKEDMYHVLYVLLECDRFNGLLPNQTIDDLLSKIKTEIEPIPSFSPVQERDFLTVLYQYALYTYQFAEKIIKKSDKKEVKMYLDKVKLYYETKPNISSDLFPSQGLQGCIIESFLEFLIMFADLLGKEEMNDSFLDLFDTTLYAFTGIKKVQNVTSEVSWLTSDYLVSCLRLNQMKISRENGVRVRLMVLVLLSSAGPNQKLIHKFVNQFTGRKNILVPNDQHARVISIKADYDMSLLLQEQIELRLTHPTKEEDPIRKEGRRKIMDELAKPIDARFSDETSQSNVNQFILMNRLNQLECILQSDRPRKTKVWPQLQSQLTASEQAKTDDEKQVILFELHRKRNVLFLQDDQVTQIHLELLQILKKKTTLAFSQIPTFYGEFTDAVITTLLTSMGRYDIHHSFLFYSILNRCVEVSEPGKIFTIHPETMLLNEEQDAFLRDLVNHAIWLVDMKVFKSDNAYIQLLLPLFESSKPLKPLYHVVNDIDSYYPFTISNWLIHEMAERNQQMKEFLLQEDKLGSTFHSWIKALPIPVKMVTIMNKYKRIMDKQRILPTMLPIFLRDCNMLVSLMDEVLDLNSDPSFASFMNELRQHVIRRWTVAKYSSFLESYSISDVEMMISYYTYGSMNHILSKLLFVYPYELEFSPFVRAKAKVERMIHALQQVKPEEKKTCESCVVPMMNRTKQLREKQDELSAHIKQLKRNQVSPSNTASINQIQDQLDVVEQEIESLKRSPMNIKIREAFSRLEKLRFHKTQLETLPILIKSVENWSEDKSDSAEFDGIQFARIKMLLDNKKKSGELPGVFDRDIQAELNDIRMDLLQKLENVNQSTDISPDGTIPQEKVDEAQRILTELTDKACVCLTAIANAQEAYQLAKGTDQEEMKWVELKIASNENEYLKEELTRQIKRKAIIEIEGKDILAQLDQQLSQQKANLGVFNKVFETLSKNPLYLPSARLRDAFTFLMDQKKRVESILNV